MIVYRLSQAVYAGDLTGMGAARAGGRWNSKGRPALYCAGSRSLAFCELLVHLPLLDLSQLRFAFTVVDVPDEGVIDAPELPSDWHEYPHSVTARAVGDAFLHANGAAVAMRLPSAIVRKEYIYLLDPQPAQRKRLRVAAIEPFTLDHRFSKHP